MTSTFWKNFSLIALSSALSPFFAVALVLVISRLRGPELLGKYSLLMAAFVVGQSCASLGFSIVLTREAACDRKQAGTCFVAASLVGLTSVAVIATLAVPTLWLLVADPDLRIALILIGFALLPSVLSGHAEALLLGLGESRPFVVAALAERAVATIACTGLVVLGYGIVGIASVTLMSRMCVAACLLVVLRKMEIPLRHTDLTMCRRFLRDIPVLASIPVVNAIYSRLDVLLLGALRGFGDLGTYSAAARLVDVVRVLPMAYARAIYPILSTLHEKGEGHMSPTLRSSNRTLALLMCCVAVILGSIGDSLIGMLYGSSFRGAGSVLRVLVWSVVPFAVASVFAQALFAASLAAVDLRVNVIALVVNTGLGLVMIPRWGAMGAAAAALASAILYAVLQYGFVAARVTEPLLAGTFARIGSAAALAWGTAWMVEQLAWPSVVAAFAALVAYALALAGNGALGKQDLVAARAFFAAPDLVRRG